MTVEERIQAISKKPIKTADVRFLLDEVIRLRGLLTEEFEKKELGRLHNELFAAAFRSHRRRLNRISGIEEPKKEIPMQPRVLGEPGKALGISVSPRGMAYG